MQKFRTKLIEVEAIQFDRSNHQQIERWSGGLFQSVGDSSNPAHEWACNDGTLHTAAGIVRVSFGDWIIKLPHGAMSYRKPGGFQDEFDAVTPDEATSPELDELRARRLRPREFLAWAIDTFGSTAKLRSERLLRFVEEAIELAHADGGMGRSELYSLINRVYSRPRGEVPKEIAQTQACLETYAESLGLSADKLAQEELDRVRMIPRAEWERRHAAKVAIGIATAAPERA